MVRKAREKIFWLENEDCKSSCYNLSSVKGKVFVCRIGPQSVPVCWNDNLLMKMAALNPCNVCPKTFEFKRGLNQHKLGHNGEKKHLCA